MKKFVCWLLVAFSTLLISISLINADSDFRSCVGISVLMSYATFYMCQRIRKKSVLSGPERIDDSADVLIKSLHDLIWVVVYSFSTYFLLGTLFPNSS